jgi:hypothetical protein
MKHVPTSQALSLPGVHVMLVLFEQRNALREPQMPDPTTTVDST